MIDINNKHNFEDLMGCCVETENEWLNKKRNGHICYGKGGGGGSQQQDVPPTLAPYITEVLDRASDLYGLDKQYVPYEGERIVDFTADEQAAQDAIRDQVGRGLLGDETLSAASTYYDPALDLLGLSGELSEKAVSEITADELMERMNPYQQAVTDLAKREAAREAQIYDQKLQAQAAGTGGFGGSRQAILEAQAAADLGTRLSDIQTKGSAAAFQDAVRAAEAQRAREAAGAQAAGGLSQLFGGLGQQALGQAYREAGYLSGIGEAKRDMKQKRADLAYDEFQKQLNFPDQQLQKFSSLIQGFPFQFTQPAAMPSQFQQTVGGLATLGGLGRGLGFFNQGGGVGNQTPNMSSMGMGAKGAGIQNKFRPPQLGMPLGAGVGPNAPGASLGANPISQLNAPMLNFPPRPPMRPTGNGLRPINIYQPSDIGAFSPASSNDPAYIKYQEEVASKLNNRLPPPQEAKALLDRFKENYDKEVASKLNNRPPPMGGFRPSRLPKRLDTGLGISGLGTINRPGMGAKGAGIRRPTTPGGVRRPKVVSTPTNPMDTTIYRNVGGVAGRRAQRQGVMDSLFQQQLEEAKARAKAEGKTLEEYLAEQAAERGASKRKRSQTPPSQRPPSVEPTGTAPAAAPAAADTIEKLIADSKSTGNTKKENELEKLLADAFKFDREGKEKAIRQQRGFDVAALGMELYSKPLSQVNPALIRQLGISQKELAGLDEAEAKAKLEAALKGLQVKKLQKELKGANVVELPNETSLARIESIASQGLTNLELKSEEYSSVLNKARLEAQYAAAYALALRGEPVDSNEADVEFAIQYERILREKLPKRGNTEGGATRDDFPARGDIVKDVMKRTRGGTG